MKNHKTLSQANINSIEIIKKILRKDKFQQNNRKFLKIPITHKIKSEKKKLTNTS